MKKKMVMSIIRESCFQSGRKRKGETGRSAETWAGWSKGLTGKTGVRGMTERFVILLTSSRQILAPGIVLWIIALVTIMPYAGIVPVNCVCSELACKIQSDCEFMSLPNEGNDMLRYSNRGSFTFIRPLVPASLITSNSKFPALKAEDVIYYTESGIAGVTSRVPLHTFTGESENLTGMFDPERNIIDFYLDLETLKTGIGRRDRDMYRTLNVNDYPYAEFTGSLVSNFDELSDEKQRVTVSGEFSINGVTRGLRLDGFMQKQGENLFLEAEWILMLDDYDIEPPGILFYRVNEEQEIRIEAVLEPRTREEFGQRD
jgi:polyisoprenoid-binding protein YceI